jgi:hypothetical protein
VRSLAGPDVTVSDLILGSTEGPLPVRARAYTQDGVPGLVEVYGRSPEQLASLKVMASLVPVGADSPITTVPADLGDVTNAGTAVMRRASFAIPLEAVTPGAYVARVRVTAGSEPVADLTRELDVRAGAAPVMASNPAVVQVRPRDILSGDLVRGTVAALKQDPSPLGQRAAQGLDLFAQEQYVPAAAQLSTVVRDLEADGGATPNRKDEAAAVSFILGWAYEGAANHRQAIGAWRAATTLSPRMVPAYLALSDGYLRLGEPALAMQALRAGLAALPDSVELQVKLSALEKR